jgi:acyl-CoA reductase-like NAD-dependent aldehyde dehydrogenase
VSRLLTTCLPKRSDPLRRYRVDGSDGRWTSQTIALRLTACIHTKSLDRAWLFCRRVQAGVAVVNAGTYGSEPHMPFGGVKQSGNGTREPGTEALDVYSSLKDIYMNITPGRV